jgi:hypothetical protein
MEDLCCYCCSEEHGCGVKSPDWIKDGTYVDTDKVRGYDANEWIPKGDNPDQVVYFETAEKIAGHRLPIRDETRGSSRDWDPNNFAPLVNGGLNLPASCSKSKTCPKESLCTEKREGSKSGFKTQTITKSQDYQARYKGASANTLRDAAKGTHVSMGTALNWRYLLTNKAYGEKAANEYNLITAEN